MTSQSFNCADDVAVPDVEVHQVSFYHRLHLTVDRLTGWSSHSRSPSRTTYDVAREHSDEGLGRPCSGVWVLAGSRCATWFATYDAGSRELTNAATAEDSYQLGLAVFYLDIDERLESLVALVASR